MRPGHLIVSNRFLSSIIIWLGCWCRTCCLFVLNIEAWAVLVLLLWFSLKLTIVSSTSILVRHRTHGNYRLNLCSSKLIIKDGRRGPHHLLLRLRDRRWWCRRIESCGLFWAMISSYDLDISAHLIQLLATFLELWRFLLLLFLVAFLLKSAHFFNFHFRWRDLSIALASPPSSLKSALFSMFWDSSAQWIIT